MKFSCTKETISDAVQTAAKAASSKSTIAVLEGLLLELSEGKLVITGYNLEIGIRTEIAVTSTDSGVTVINARMLCDVIRKLKSGVIEFDIDDKCANISQGETKLMIMVMDPKEYIPIPQPDMDGGFTLPQKTLKSMITQTRYACATVDTKPALTGCLFELENGVLSVVAVDGIRIALRREPVASEDIRFVVPPRTLDELTHLLSDDEEQKVTVSVERNQISFLIGSYTMISRLLDGEFIDYKKHLKIGDDRTAAVVNCREILDVLDRSMLFLNDKNKAPLRCMFENDKLRISVSTGLGKSEDMVNITYGGTPISIGFNAKFLMDAFKAADTDSVKVLLTSSNVSPVIIVPMDGEEFTFLLLPMRLK
ncbi:MAG: DNA polymerase III subunit beta [Oscillospiraceae bacterium]